MGIIHERTQTDADLGLELVRNPEVRGVSGFLGLKLSLQHLKIGL